jgi:hypothetical protein
MYSSGDALAESLLPLNGSFCNASIGHYSNATSPIQQKCQGAAYAALLQELNLSAALPWGPAALASYNSAEQILNRLALYAWVGQPANEPAFAAWILPASANANPMMGGVFNVWYSLQYDPAAGAPLAVRGPFSSYNPVPSAGAFVASALATGGFGGYSYKWSGLPSGCIHVTNRSPSCTGVSPGLYNVTVTVTDQSGKKVTSSLLALRVLSPPTPRVRRRDERWPCGGTPLPLR